LGKPMKTSKCLALLTVSLLLFCSIVAFEALSVRGQTQNTTNISLVNVGKGQTTLATQTTHTSGYAAKLLIPTTAPEGSGCLALYPYNRTLSTLQSFQVYTSFSNAVPRFVISLDTNNDGAVDSILLSDYQFQSNYNWQLTQGGQRWGWTQATPTLSTYGKIWEDLNYWKNNYANATALEVGVALEYWAVKDSGGLDQSLFADEVVINGLTYNISPSQSIPGSQSSNQTTSSNWAMYRHDPQGTGYINTSAPNGNFLWRFNTGDKIRSSPVVVDGVVYEGSNTGCVYALNASNGALIWQYNSGSNIDGSPAVANGMVFIGILWDGSHGYVTALNSVDGTVVWKFATNSGVESSPTVVDGIVYIGSYSGSVYALNSTNGKQVWSYLLGGTAFSSPAIVDGVLYIGCGNGKVYALNANNGALIWTAQAGDIIYSSPAVVNNIVYVVSENGNVFALSSNDGKIIWQMYAGSGTDHTDTSPAVANGIVYICARNGNYAFNASNGSQIWFFTSPYSPRQTTGYMYSSPAVAGNIAYFGSVDSYIFAANASNGNIIWTYRTGGFLFASPAIADGNLYIGSYDGYIYALGGTDTLLPETPSPSPTATPQPTNPTPTATPTPGPTTNPTPKPTQKPIPTTSPSPCSSPNPKTTVTPDPNHSATFPDTYPDQHISLANTNHSEKFGNQSITIAFLAAFVIIATEVGALLAATLIAKKKPDSSTKNP
jgi:outer membrane protein assembly factor BamB